MERPAAGPAWLDERLAAGELVLLDGAMGTELEARGVPMHGVAWSGAALLEHGEVARRIHEDYIGAGADVVITNTFAAARHVLEFAGLGERVAEINTRAVALAAQARERAAERPVAIAGSISHFIADQAGPEWRRPDRLAATFREQAEILAEAGVDLIALEMMMHLELARPALDAAVATGLPVWVGLSCRRAPEGAGLVARDEPHESFDDLIAGLAGGGAGLFTVMHSDVADTGAGLEALRRHWPGPSGAYPNSGYFRMPNWQFVDIIAPDELVAEARGWIARGAQVIGGCCGIGPAHIRRLKEALF